MSAFGSIPKPIDVWRDTHWFVIHTKSRWETFAATTVSALRLRVEILLPRLKVERLVHGAVRAMTKPLFPGYFFARFCPENALESIECSRGVLYVVSSGKFPIPVDDEVIREIRVRMKEDGLIRIRTQRFTPGSRVSIVNGPFEGFMGTVERELDDGRRLAILLETLLHARVLIEKRWVKAEAA